MDDYSSDFEASTSRRKAVTTKAVDNNLLNKPDQRSTNTGFPNRHHAREEFDRQRWLAGKQHLVGMNAVDRHQEMVRNYLMYYGGQMQDFKRDTSKDRDDVDVLKSNHRFLWNDDEQEAAECASNWERRLAKKYYDKLFREFAIADLSHYQLGKLALRWRIEREVLSGKGQFECAAKRCESKANLSTWEVNFAYVEDNVKKNALVKLRLCPSCSDKLNYKNQARRISTPAASSPASTSNATEVSAASSSKKRANDANKRSDEASSPKKSKKDTEDSKISALEKKIWSASAQPEKEDDEEANRRSLDEEIDSFLNSLLV